MERLDARLVISALALAFGAACGAAAGSQPATQPGEAGLAAALVLPPTEATSGALEQLERLANGGGPAARDAAWSRIHYLLDAFDTARFADNEPARDILFAGLDAGAEGRGQEPTDRVIVALLRSTDDLLARFPDHAEARRARVLLGHDQQAPRSRSASLQRTIELATLARSASDLATNARLRLAAWCLRALDDAAAAPPRRAGVMAAQCLYPLYDADPAAYFADDPARRPPPPAARDLVDGTDALLATAEKTPGRMARVATALRRDLQSRRDALLAALPERPDPRALGVPVAQPAALYDQQPLVTPSARIDPNKLRDRLTAALATDGRRQVAIALPTDDAGALYSVAGPARAAGAEELLVAVATEQQIQVPAGDYWNRAGGLEPGLRTVPRLGVLPVVIAEPGPDSSAARAERWDPRRAQLRLHLLVSNKGWVVRTPGSVLADSPGTIEERTEAVRDALSRVRDAFSDEDAAYLAIEPGTSAEQLVRALEAAARTSDGAPLFSAVFLVPSIEAGKADGVEQRVARRAAARVTVRPTELERRAPALRACYQRALDKGPTTGRVRLELRDGETRATGGPRPLRDCATAALTDVVESESMASAEVVFSIARP